MAKPIGINLNDATPAAPADEQNVKFQVSAPRTLADGHALRDVSAHVPLMKAASAGADGQAGLVPKPVAGQQNYFLRGDKLWVPVSSVPAGGAAGQLLQKASGADFDTVWAGKLPATFAAVAHKWLASFDASTGLFAATQPAYSDLTGLPILPVSMIASAHKWLASYDAPTGLFTQTQPAYTDLSGLPVLAATIAATAHKFLTSYDASTGTFTAAQPDFSDLTGAATEAQLSFSDVTTANASATKHGLLPKLPNDNTKYLNGVGAWATPSGGGGGGSSSFPDLAPGSPSAYDDEFATGSSLDAKWTITGGSVLDPQGNVSAYLEYDVNTSWPSYLRVLCSKSGVTRFSMRQNFTPGAGAFTFVGKFRLLMYNNYMSANLYFSDSTLNNAIRCGIEWNGNGTQYVSAQSTLSKKVSGTWAFNISTNMTLVPGTIFIAAQRDASNNWNTWVSVDGFTWKECQPVNNFTSGFTIAYMFVSMGENQSAISNDYLSGCDWVRYNWLTLPNGTHT